MTPVDRVLDALAAQTGRKPSRNGTGWRSRCPAHDDRKPSLSIGVGDNGKVLLHCHAGCATADILAALGLTMRDLMPDNGAGPHRRGPSASRPAAKPAARGLTFPTADAVIASVRFGAPSATFEYRDAAGELVAIVARWDRDGGKEIRPVTRTAGGWRIGAADEPRLLYRLPELVASSGLIYVAEGEGCAEALAASGLTATTSSGGSQAAGKSDWSPLRGRDVVIVPDHDEPGRKYADDVARLAREAGAASVRIVDLREYWPDIPPGGDVADLLARLNGDGDELRRILEQLAAEAEPVAADDDDAERDETRPGTTFAAALDGLIDAVHDARPLVVTLPVNVPLIDDSCGGLVRGEYLGLAAGPGVGKSTFADMLVVNALSRDRTISGLVFNLETSTAVRTARILCGRAVRLSEHNAITRYIPLGRVLRGELEPSFSDTLDETAAELRDAIGDRLTFIDNVSDAAAIARIIRERRPDVVLVDHIGLVRCAGDGSVVEQFDRALAELQSALHETNAAGILINEISKVGLALGTADLSAVRGSARFASLAGMFLGMARVTDDEADGTGDDRDPRLTIQIFKARHGRAFTQCKARLFGGCAYLYLDEVEAIRPAKRGKGKRR